MKLSEAIRLGAMMGPQVFNQYGESDGSSSCAVGAALVAIQGSYSDQFYAAWPWSLLRYECPVCNMAGNLFTVITRLNDEHRWTRERIADWVATIEPEEVHASETIREVQFGQGTLKIHARSRNFRDDHEVELIERETEVQP
jgi:hypothetical protein